MTEMAVPSFNAGAYRVECLDRFSEANTNSYWNSLLLSSLLVFALWGRLPSGSLLAWAGTVWATQTGHELYCRYYRQRRRGDLAGHGRWLRGFWLWVAVLGVCWSLPFFLFDTLADDGVMLLVFAMAGVTAYGGVTCATVLSVAVLFEVATLLPIVVWLFRQDSASHRLMGVAVLFYLVLLLPLLRKMNQMVTRTLLLDEENRNRVQEYRALAASLPVAIIRYDTSQRRRYINPAAQRMLHGNTPQMLDLLPGEGGVPATPTMIERYRGRMAQVLATGESREFEFALDALPEGSQRQYEVRMAPERGADGKIAGALAIWFDITERKQAETLLLERYERITELNARLEENARTLEDQAHELETSQAHLRDALAFANDVINAIPDILFETDRDGRYLHVWTQNPDVLATQKDALIGKTVYDVLPEDVADMAMVGIQEADEKGVSYGGTLPIVQINGETRWYEHSVSKKNVSSQGQPTFLVISRDVTDRKRMEQALALREQEFRTLVENTVDTVARYGPDLRRLYVNPAFAAQVEGGAAALLGKKPTECVGGPGFAVFEERIAQVFATGAGDELELTGQGRAGHEVCRLIRLTPEFDAHGEVTSVLAVGRDITELHAYRHKIHQMAFYDTLTGLPNRALFGDRLRQMITDASWHGQQAGLMMLDMDRFKAVNDTLGHAAGDELLREAATRLGSCVRAYDTVARLGGDEFAILLPEMRAGDDLGRIASKVLASFERPFQLAGKEVFVSCSIGIVLYPDDGAEADDLLKYADSAMYSAKRAGRNNFRFYSRDLTDNAHERLALESDLRRAIERDELVLFYQPKVDLSDGALTGSEALLRWQHPERGLLPPDTFIGIAEDSGLIVEMGEWVLRESCRMARRWNGDGKPLHKVAINLSARQFQWGDLAETVRRALSESGCRAEWIELEITESLLLDDDSGVLDVLNNLRVMGVSIAIDDFGTGYSALSYLARFPIGTLKIDRSFISHVTTDKYRAELVKAILSIARCLGQQVVAEGVETEAQANFLRAHGCQVAQGYLYGKPMPVAEFECLPMAFSR